jgi:hypothetical protein
MYLSKVKAKILSGAIGCQHGKLFVKDRLIYIFYSFPSLQVFQMPFSHYNKCYNKIAGKRSTFAFGIIIRYC